MNKWVLLQHEIERQDCIEVHYDFLVEYGKDCLTWKFFEIPQINGPPVQIIKQENHRLVWLYRKEYTLSNARGKVQRKDHGTYHLVEDFVNEDDFSLILNGNIFYGILKKTSNLCQLIPGVN